MLHSSFLKELEFILTQQLNQEIKVISSCSVSGGDINDAYQVKTNKGPYFIKKNHASRFPNMFKKEASGLKLLRASNTFNIPQIIVVGEIEGESFLMLEWIESSSPQTNFWKNFGKLLAQMHQNTHSMFGLDHDNYMGSLHQSNQQHSSWIEFFINERLQPQIKLAMGQGRMNASDLSKFENLFKRLNDIFPEEPPALVHGDLWSGNYIVGNNGEPVIIDPAVYYGHREMDIAMTRLFGGFSPKMYEAYQEHYPLEKGWEDRINIYNLYPLLIHVNLFGGSYVYQVQQIVQPF